MYLQVSYGISRMRYILKEHTHVVVELVERDHGLLQGPVVVCPNALPKAKPSRVGQVTTR